MRNSANPRKEEAHVSAGLNNRSYLLGMSLLGMFQETVPDPAG